MSINCKTGYVGRLVPSANSIGQRLKSRGIFRLLSHIPFTKFSLAGTCWLACNASEIGSKTIAFWIFKGFERVGTNQLQ